MKSVISRCFSVLGLLALSNTLSVANAQEPSPAPEELSCTQKNPREEGAYQTLRLVRAENGNYSLKYTAVIEDIGTIVEIPETALVENLRCSFSNSKSQVLHCEILQDLPANPAIRGPNGPIRHVLTVRETTINEIKDGKLVSSSKRNLRYSRGQQIWVSRFSLRGKYLPNRWKKTGDAQVEFENGSITMDNLASDCFTY